MIRKSIIKHLLVWDMVRKISGKKQIPQLHTFEQSGY